MNAHLSLIVLTLLELAPSHGLATAVADFGDPLRWAAFAAGLTIFTVAAAAAILAATLVPRDLAPGSGHRRNPRLDDSALRDQVEDVIALQPGSDDAEQ